MKRLFLIDAHALCYRSYFAIKSLSNSKGQATNAVYGFVNTLKKILREYEPHYMAVCFDVGKKTKRQERFAEYKIQRPSMPDDLISQIPIIKEVVEAFNLPVVEMEGYEADDVIATLVKQFAQKGIEAVIVSDDKDMYQLLGPKVKILSTRKDAMIGEAEAKEILGVEPQHITDLIALAGDQVDNIPGVNGIGEVTARNLVQEFGSLENIYKHAEKIKSAKVREKLLDQKDIANLSKELSLLDADVPVNIDLNDVEVREPNSKKLFELFKELEFRKFAEEFAAAPSAHQSHAVKHLEAKEDITEVIKKIQKRGRFSFLCEAANQDEGALFSVIVLTDGKNVYQIPEEKISDLQELFEDSELVKVTHNIKEAMKVLASHECYLRGKMFDVMLAGYLLSPAQAGFDVGTLVWEYLKVSVAPDADMAANVKFVDELYKLLAAQLKDKELLKLFDEIEIPLSYVLFRMETAGVALDEQLLNDLSRDAQKKIQAIELDLYKMAGETFNLNSPKQLSQVLFEKMKLPVVKKTKTGFSTDEGVLTKLAEKHDFPAKILEYRQLAKLKSTYFDALPRSINPRTGRLHASFNQTGAETGRLSSSNPNLQNIPIRTEMGREIRKAFIPSAGNFLISADYSQVELRILAHLSGDETLKKAFLAGEDIHRFTAALIFDVKEDDVTPQMRTMAKRVNFGIIYGMSAFGLSKDLNISAGEAQDFIEKYFLRYPDVKKFMDNEIRKCRERGYVVTLLNRRRYIPEIKSDNIGIRQFAERQAINTPVQGSAADLLKLSMINIQKDLEKRRLLSKMIITVHDELVFDCVKKEEKELIALIRQEMEHPLELSVPIEVSVKVGNNWRDVKEIK